MNRNKTGQTLKRSSVYMGGKILSLDFALVNQLTKEQNMFSKLLKTLVKQNVK